MQAGQISAIGNSINAHPSVRAMHASTSLLSKDTLKLLYILA